MPRTIRCSSAVQSVHNAAQNPHHFPAHKTYNQSNMQPAFSTPFPELYLAAMPQLREKPHQGVQRRNQRLHRGDDLVKAFTALGLQGV